MNQSELLKIIHVAEKLKCNPRHCYTSSGRRESVAEHCWRVSLMAMLIEKEFPSADMNKVIKMCLIHDLGEAFTGDIPAFYKSNKDEKKEENILINWVKTFPEYEQIQWLDLYEEMRQQKTEEAKIYKALDKMEAVIQHDESDIKTWLPLEYNLQLKYGADNVLFSDYMKELKKQIDTITLEKIEESKKEKRGKEILKLHINVIDVKKIESKNSTVQMVLFDGMAEGEYFNGIIEKGGVDTQKYIADERGSLSARYMLSGKDFRGNECSIFIENNAFVGESETLTNPKIFTDSPELQWLQNANLYGKICNEKEGLVIYIFEEE